MSLPASWTFGGNARAAFWLPREESKEACCCPELRELLGSRGEAELGQIGSCSQGRSLLMLYYLELMSLGVRLGQQAAA